MLRIRKEQMEALGGLDRERFLQRVIKNLEAHFPTECGQLKEGALGELVLGAAERASALGIESEFDVQRFCNISFVLGANFDSDPQYPWAANILEDDELMASDKVDALCFQAEEAEEDMRQDAPS